MVIVLVPLLPWATVKVFGEAVKVKFPSGCTVSASVVVELRLPEVPVIVTVAVPAFAVLPAVRVRTLVEAAGFGSKAAVTPFGSPEAANRTLPENPPAGTTAMVLVALPEPSTVAMVTAFGEAERLKLGGVDVTVRLSVVLFVKVPELPLIVTVTVPAAAVALAFRVNVLVEVVGFALKDAVTPLGKPAAESVTLALKPFCGVTVIVLVPLPPCAMFMLAGEEARVKLGLLASDQLFTRLAAFTVPIPVAKSQPVVAPYAG
jgi:hypothetical protein